MTRPRIFRALGSLRLQLIAGATALGVVAVSVAGLTAWNTREAARLTAVGLAAQDRVELYETLTQKVSEYAVVVVESTSSGLSREAQLTRLSEREHGATDAFENLKTALDSHFSTVPQDANDPSMRRATQSSRALVRLRTRFFELNEAITRPQQTLEGVTLRVTLDNFAGFFSPMLSQQIGQDKQFRDAAFTDVKALQATLIPLALTAALLTPVLMTLIYFFLIRPLLSRLSEASDLAGHLGDVSKSNTLPLERRDELGLLFARVNLMTKRLDRRHDQVEKDRARLAELVAERTKELQAANTRLSQVDAERRRFFADIGHELRTPLTVILGEAELADTANQEQSKEAFGIIRARAKRLNLRIDDLLRIARSESGQIELNRSRIVLGDVINSALDDLQPLFKRSRCTVTFACDMLELDGDADWLRQVIGGIFENAVKYAGPDFQLDVVARREGENAVLAITDDGPGLPADTQTGVFERFTRGAQNQEARGFGVGLALARWIIEEHNGAITIESPVVDGTGTRLDIRLPLARIEKDTG